MKELKEELGIGRAPIVVIEIAIVEHDDHIESLD